MERHPERFLDGNAVWRGRIYSQLPFVKSISRVRVNAGVWGTAAFPSVYCTHVPSLTFLPHLIQWQLIAATFLIAGAVALAMGRRTLAFTLLAAAVAGLATTVSKCAVCAWQSDIDRLSTIGRLPRGLSRIVYRFTIAWLHFLQPLARAWGRIRGQLWPPDVDGTRVTAVILPKAPLVAQLIRGVALLFSATGRVDFWAEQWADRTELLTRITGRVRSAGVGRTVSVDDGWQLDRDFGVAVGRWGWLNISTLVEEHARGRCLFRVAMRVRVTRLGLLMAAFIGSALFFAAISSSAVAFLAVATATLLLSKTLRQLARVEAAVRVVINQVADEYRMTLLQQRSNSFTATAQAALNTEPVSLVNTSD